jgi:hypothetical protein
MRELRILEGGFALGESSLSASIAEIGKVESIEYSQGEVMATHRERTPRRADFQQTTAPLKMFQHCA